MPLWINKKVCMSMVVMYRKLTRYNRLSQTDLICVFYSVTFVGLSALTHTTQILLNNKVKENQRQ